MNDLLNAILAYLFLPVAFRVCEDQGHPSPGPRQKILQNTLDCT